MGFKTYLVVCIFLICLRITTLKAATCITNKIYENNNNWGSWNSEGFTGYGYMMQDTRQRVDCCGVVTDWTARVWYQGASQDVYFQVWRLITGNTYQLIVQKSYTVTTDANITVSLTPSEMKTVHTDDCFGWWTSGSNNVIKYHSAGGSSYDDNRYWSMSLWTVGQPLDWGSATNEKDKNYPVKLLVKPNTRPTFTNLDNTVTLSASSRIATFVFTVSYQDVDIDDVSTLALSMTAKNKYSFSSVSGNVTTVSSLVASAGTTDLLVFTITDQCDNSFTATLTVSIKNEPPVINNLPASTYLSEDVTLETLLYTINATDADGTFVRCSLANPASSPFVLRQIPSSTAYAIYCESSPGFSYTTTNQYALDIECTDDIEVDNGTFTVYLIQNTPPVFLNLQNATVISTAYETGDTVFEVLVNDSVTDDLTFSMTCDASPCPFSIFDSGAILVTEVLTFLTTVGYDLQITVSDGRTTVGPKTLTVTIADINDPVTITNLPTTISVNENSQIGMSLFQVLFSDKDIGQLHTVSMTSLPAAGSNLFAISSGGNITVSGMINYEALAATTYVFDVTVSDPVTSDKRSLTVIVNNVNEAPSFSQSSYSLSAKEGSAGYILGTPPFGLSDPDAGDNKTLTLDCGVDTAYFSMNSNTGEVSYQSNYDLDTGSLATSIPCIVTVTDSSGLQDTANLLIKIVDDNDNVPIFSPVAYTFYVSYYATAGTSVGVISARDRDIGEFGVLTYTLDQSSLSVEHFAINNNGSITVKTTPKGSAVGYATSVTLTALASDIEGQSDTATVVIIISDTTTTSTTTTTDRYRTFFEDGRNIAWVSAGLVVSLIAIVAVIYVVWTCHGAKGCAQFKQTLCNKRRIFRPRDHYTYDRSRKEDPGRIRQSPIEEIVERRPPPPKEFQFWRSEM